MFFMEVYEQNEIAPVAEFSSEIKDIDKELEELLKKQSARIKVIGIGGGGGNSLSRMREIGIKGGELIAINTDAQDLLYANADQKILIGKELTQGLGAGSNPRIGEEAAKESASEIKRKISGTPKNEGLKKWYVAKKDARKNILILAPKNHPLLYKKEIFIKNPYWISEVPKNNSKIYSRIRQVGELLPSKLIKQKNKLKIINGLLRLHEQNNVDQ